MCSSDVDSFVKSHIVPEAIAAANLEGDQFLLMAGDAGHPKRIQTGVYSRIVCDLCERSFKGDDDYLTDVYKGLDQAAPVLEDQGSLLEGVDALRLQRSILSVLYRAHLSDHELYAKVNLGPHAEELTRFLRSGELAAPRVFSIVLRHLNGKLASVVMSPAREHLGGVNVYRLFIPSLTAIVRVDQRPFNSDFRDCQLSGGQPVVAMRFDRLTPSESRLLHKFANHHRAAFSKAFSRRRK
jgi:hypothetical protein